MLGGEDKEEEKEYYKIVRTSVSSTQGQLIHFQEKGYRLMALDIIQPEIASNHSTTIKSKIKYRVSHLCSNLHSYKHI